MCPRIDTKFINYSSCKYPFFKDFHCLLNKEFERLGGDHCETVNVVTCRQEVITFNFREFSKEWLIMLLDQFLSDLDQLIVSPSSWPYVCVAVRPEISLYEKVEHIKFQFIINKHLKFGIFHEEHV